MVNTSLCYVLPSLLTFLLTACAGVANKADRNNGTAAVANKFASKVVRNPVSRHAITINGEMRQYLSLDIGNSQKDTIIFYFTGSGCHDISYLLNPLYGNLSVNGQLIALTKKGVKPKSAGKTCSDKFVDYDNLDNLVTDATALMKQLLQRRGYKNIVVAGHSEGGDIIWRLAEKIPAITHVFSMHRGLGMNNLDELKLIAKTKQGTQRTIYEQLITDLEGKSNFYRNDDFILIRKKQSWQVSVSDRRNPAQVLLKSNKKVMIMMGNEDKHVPVRSLYAANKVYCDARSNLLTAIIKKGHGHRIDVGTPERLAELDILARWLKREAIELSPPFQGLACS